MGTVLFAFLNWSNQHEVRKLWDLQCNDTGTYVLKLIYFIEFSKLDLIMSFFIIEVIHQNQWGWGVTMKKKVLIPVLILSVVGIALVYFLTTGNIGTKYNTVEVKRGSLEKYVEEVGIIRSKNIRQYYSNGSGKVEAVDIELGDKVNKGQILVKFEDNMDLEIQKVEKQIKALEATYKDILQGTDIQSVNNAKIEISRIRSDLELALKNKERIEELYKNGAVSLVELERAVNNYDQLGSALAVAQNNYSQLTKGVSASSREKYEAEIDILLLTLESLERSQDNSTIVADIDGVVTELKTFEGDMPYPGSLVLEIQDPNNKVVSVDFIVEDALKINEGMKASIDDSALDIHIDSLKVDKKYPKAFTTVSVLGEKENRQTVEINLPQTEDVLSYGIEVNTRVVIEEAKEALLIPKGSVYQMDSRDYVKILENGKPAEREITIGLEMDNQVEVRSGLSVGDLVILNYQDN